MKTGIEKFIPKIRDYFVTQPINKAWIFGSYSRGEETEKSDKKVDLVENGQLMDFAVNSVNHDKILIYGRELKISAVKK